MNLTFQKTLLMKAVLDTTVHGPDVNTSLLLKDEGTHSMTVGSTDQTDSAKSLSSSSKLKYKLYKLICNNNVEVSFTFLYG